MNQQLLKNIYETFGSLQFRYHGQLMQVTHNVLTDEYSLIPYDPKYLSPVDSK